MPLLNAPIPRECRVLFPAGQILAVEERHETFHADDCGRLLLGDQFRRLNGQRRIEFLDPRLLRLLRLCGLADRLDDRLRLGDPPIVLNEDVPQDQRDSREQDGDPAQKQDDSRHDKP